MEFVLASDYAEAAVRLEEADKRVAALESLLNKLAHVTPGDGAINLAITLGVLFAHMKDVMKQVLKAFLLPLLLGAPAAHAGVCETGRQQSPIDIRGATRASLPALRFAYRAAPLKLADDGHTVRVRFGDSGELRIGTERYVLQQFHFHTPGGDRIAGEEFPMAAHLLHKSSSGQLLAVVVFFRLGSENPLLASLLPLIPTHADGDHLHSNVMISATDLLPAHQEYFRYSGSLTAPPCTEGVDWIVLKQPLELSAAQLAIYRKRFADNARAVQPTNSRVVLESQ